MSYDMSRLVVLLPTRLAISDARQTERGFGNPMMRLERIEGGLKTAQSFNDRLAANVRCCTSLTPHHALLAAWPSFEPASSISMTLRKLFNARGTSAAV